MNLREEIVAADLTTEVFILNTASRNGLPDGSLALAEESTEHWMSGVYGLNWFPTGPEVLKRVLRWMGFPAVRCVSWIEGGAGQPSELGRIEVVASRRPELLDDLPDLVGPSDRAQGG